MSVGINNFNHSVEQGTDSGGVGQAVEWWVENTSDGWWWFRNNPEYVRSPETKATAALLLCVTASQNLHLLTASAESLQSCICSLIMLKLQKIILLTESRELGTVWNCQQRWNPKKAREWSNVDVSFKQQCFHRAALHPLMYRCVEYVTERDCFQRPNFNIQAHFHRGSNASYVRCVDTSVVTQLWNTLLDFWHSSDGVFLSKTCPLVLR